MGGGIKRPGGPINPMEQLKRQSGSGMLMTRALGVGAPGPAPGPLPGPMNNPQQQPGPRYPNPARPQAPGQLRPRNQVPMQGTSGGVGGMGQPRPPVQRGNGPATGAQSVGSGSTGSFYADQPSKPADGTNYVGGGLWHTDQKADEGSASTMDRPTVDHRAYLPNDPRLTPQRVGGSTPLKANLVQPAVEQDDSYQSMAPAGQGQQSQGATSMGQQSLQSAAGRSPVGGSFNMRQNGGQMAGTSGLTSMRGQGNGMPGQGGAQPSPYTMGGAGSAPVSITPQGGGGGGGGGGSPAPAPAQSNVGSSQSALSSGPIGDTGGYTQEQWTELQKRKKYFEDQGFIVDDEGNVYGGGPDGKGATDYSDKNNNKRQGNIHAGKDDEDALDHFGNYGNGEGLPSRGKGYTRPGDPNPDGSPGAPSPNQQFVNDAVAKTKQTPLSDIGPPPQVDEADLAATDAASSAAYAQKRARAIRGMAEAGAYAGAGAEQAAGQQGEAGIQYDLAAGAERAKSHLQAKIQNFQAQMDYYNKAFQARMAEFQATQNQEAFKQALEFAKYNAKLAKEMAKYQKELGDSVSPSDILGPLFQVGGTALGLYVGGPGGAMAGNAAGKALSDNLWAQDTSNIA